VHILFNLIICERKKIGRFILFLDDDKKYILKENVLLNLLDFFGDKIINQSTRKATSHFHSSLSLSETEKCLHVVKFAVRF
jgi:hypothetical protein